jgi:hypothetical protein
MAIVPTIHKRPKMVRRCRWTTSLTAKLRQPRCAISPLRMSASALRTLWSKQISLDASRHGSGDCPTAFDTVGECVNSTEGAFSLHALPPIYCHASEQSAL